MTYILGARCKDGVVLIGDRKVELEEGTDFGYEDKMFMDVNNLVIGSSGVSELFDKFRTRLLSYITKHPKGTDIDTFVIEVENITKQLNENYRDALMGGTFGVLIGIKLPQTSILQYVPPYGVAGHVRKYKVIGHGEPYGSVFLKQLWNRNMTMKQTAELRFFVIKYIEELQLDNSVGSFPQIWFIPDPPKEEMNNNEIITHNAHEADQSYIDSLKELTKPMIGKFKDNIGQIFSK